MCTVCHLSYFLHHLTLVYLHKSIGEKEDFSVVDCLLTKGTYGMNIKILFHFFLFILVVRPRALRKANLISVLAKSPNGEKTRNKVSVLYVERKPQNVFPVRENPHSHVGRGLKTQSTQCPRCDSNQGLEVEGEERYHYAKGPYCF